MGGLKLNALAALVKLALKANGEDCPINWLAVQGAGVRLTTKRHNSQVSQLQLCAATSSPDAECITQSAGMATRLDALAMVALATVMAAMSTAMTLPAQPRKGSKTSIETINRKRERRYTR